MATTPTLDLDQTTKQQLDQWLGGNFDAETKRAVRDLMTRPAELLDAFYTHLKFGTAGMRGLMGVGSNRMNIYTVRRASLGLARYLKKQFQEGTPLSICIGYDSRIHSREFAEEAAKVFAAEGIKSYIFTDIRPVPLVSFGTRHLGAQAGVMITASHNPARYNGYKVYWSDGGQVLPPHDKGIVAEVEAITALDSIPTEKIDHPLIVRLGEDVDVAYFQTIAELQNNPQDNQERGESLRIVYTPLHGTGITVVPQALALWGFMNMRLVESQSKPDGHFPTVIAPNPEIPSTLKAGIDLVIETEGDILLATDADTDRVGCVVNHKGAMKILDGNEIGAIILYHLLQTPKKNCAIVKSIVTTELLNAIAKSGDVAVFETLPGFKYIGDKITRWEKEADAPHFLFGAEESFGYLISNYARDKDAVIACLLLAEAALQAKLHGKTLVDLLKEIYSRFGVFRSELTTIDFPETKEGHEQMARAMSELRKNPPKQLLGNAVISIDDYLTLKKSFLKEKKEEPLLLPKSDVLVFWLSDGTKVDIRPSGTEPKVKLYTEVKSKGANVELGIEHCDVIADEVARTLKNLLLS